MNILLDIGHPAHVHLYRNFYSEMTKRGHNILVTVKDIPSAINLLELYGIPFINIGKRGGSIISKGLNQIRFNASILKLAWSNKIDIGLGSSISNCHVSRLSPMTSIIFDDDDDEVQPLMTHFGHPFAQNVLSPDALKGRRRKRSTIYYPGYHELAYLHPNRFKPDPSVLKLAGLNEADSFFIMRFNAFKAHHDIGARGLSLENKVELATFLSRFGKVFITTEQEIEPELSGYQLRLPAHKAHSLLSFATMFIGDSQTMTSEASILGIPSVRCNTFAGRISYLEEQEKKFGLTYAFRPEEFSKAMKKIEELLNTPALRETWKMKQMEMLKEKIDVTAFMIWFVENYPSSRKILKEAPQTFSKFK